MKHGDYLVDILDKQGRLIGKKPRREINKQVDICHTVFGLLKVGENMFVLGLIDDSRFGTSLYNGLYGAPMATIKRYQEAAEQAAIRGFKEELDIAQKPELIGEGMLQLQDGIFKFASIFVVNLRSVEKLKVKNPICLTSHGLDTKIDEPNFAPTLQEIWRTYRAKL
ncbi:MAG TPA: hypothetical protein VLA77_00700 [Candidatus Saccharimonadales bacterium]|nr:hypothetical protein [Candidatus Saccharimonadales bacterium]